MNDVLLAVGFLAVVTALGLWNRRRNRVVVRDPRVAVLRLDSNAALARADADEYRRQFSSVTESCDLDSLAGAGVDVLHVLAAIDAEGRIGGHTAVAFQRAVGALNPRLVILASDNSGDAYTAALREFGSSGYNLVMVISRQGPKFWEFFHRLFDLMFQGRTMPMAWVALAPQIPGKEHPDVPAMICTMGAGQLVFLRGSKTPSQGRAVTQRATRAAAG